MKIRHIARIAGAIVGLTLLFGAGVGSKASSYVQARGDQQDRRNRNGDGYPNLGGSFDLRQTALNAGYNEGTKEGRKDRAKGRQSNFRQFSAYQKATKDYSSRLGDRELYRRYFQMAFENGYTTELGIQVPRDDRRDIPPGYNRDQDRRGRNWDRYGTYGGSNELRQTALNAGYNQGIKEGRKDRRKGRASDIRNFSAYQKATTDYSSKLGDRELYRRYYRQGFETGYKDGYDGY